jgi:hypothetical protein
MIHLAKRECQNAPPISKTKERSSDVHLARTNARYCGKAYCYSSLQVSAYRHLPPNRPELTSEMQFKGLLEQIRGNISIRALSNFFRFSYLSSERFYTGHFILFILDNWIQGKNRKVSCHFHFHERKDRGLFLDSNSGLSNDSKRLNMSIISGNSELESLPSPRGSEKLFL